MSSFILSKFKEKNRNRIKELEAKILELKKKQVSKNLLFFLFVPFLLTAPGLKSDGKRLKRKDCASSLLTTLDLLYGLITSFTFHSVHGFLWPSPCCTLLL